MNQTLVAFALFGHSIQMKNFCTTCGQNTSAHLEPPPIFKKWVTWSFCSFHLKSPQNITPLFNVLSQCFKKEWFPSDLLPQVHQNIWRFLILGGQFMDNLHAHVHFGSTLCMSIEKNFICWTRSKFAIWYKSTLCNFKKIQCRYMFEF